MKKIILSTMLLFSAACLADADLATVNGIPIKQSLVDYIIKDATKQGKALASDAQTGIVDKLITTQVLVQEAQKTGVLQQPDYLAKQELTIQELQVNAYLEDYLQKNPVDEATLKQEYDALKAHVNGKEYKASHILVGSEAEAEAIIAKLNKGADFAQLAKQQSLDSSKDNGGDLGWFQTESMVQPFADAVKALQKGQFTTTPVQTEYGWHVIQLVDTRNVQPPSFDSVKEQLREAAQHRQLSSLINQLLARATIVNNSTK
jgi:peptidyl-prolyl cis-trans isomerase C